MMPTVSLRARVVGSGVAVVAVVLVALDVFVYVNLRDRLLDNLEGTLDRRAAQAGRLPSGAAAGEVLTQLGGGGVRVMVRAADGRIVATTEGPSETGPWLTRDVPLAGGGHVELSISRAPVEETLRRLILPDVLGSVAGIALAAALLATVSRIALRPLDGVVAAARRIGAGRTGERLQPNRTTTELGRMAFAFDEMLDALEAALAEARASDQRSRRFLAEAAHQLRTPLAGIQASVEALPSARTPAERERILANAARESARAGRRVTALLRMARLDQGETPSRTRCDLVGLVQSEVARAAPLAPRLAVSFESTEPELLVDLDAEGIREAVANLLDNARRHATSRVIVTLHHAGAYAELHVVDDGPGLPGEERERVFERFVSLDGQGGSGLGLPIARAVARLHGGDVTYELGAFVLKVPFPRKDDRTESAGGPAGWRAASAPGGDPSPTTNFSTCSPADPSVFRPGE